MIVKKIWIIGMLAVLLLTGCAEEMIETVNDVYPETITVQARQILLDVPKEAAMAVMENDSGEALYQCDGYELRLQTLPAGNLTGTLRQVTGFTEEELTLIQTIDQGYNRYDCVWCAAGAEGELVGKTAVIDDGNYYYCVSVLSPEEQAGNLRESWKRLFDSITLG